MFIQIQINSYTGNRIEFDDYLESAHYDDLIGHIRDNKKLFKWVYN